MKKRYTVFEELALRGLLNIEPPKPTLDPALEALIMGLGDDDDDSQVAEHNVGPIDLTSKRSGRRPDKENLEACKMVLDGGKTDQAYREAFSYWCDKKNIDDPKAGDRRNFKRRMEVAEKWIAVPK